MLTIKLYLLNTIHSIIFVEKIDVAVGRTMGHPTTTWTKAVGWSVLAGTRNNLIP
jgi:hypothetical protein